MSGERLNNQKTSYGTLIMHPYVIFGNDIAAFYDSNDNLVFVLDRTLNARKPNVLLVINPSGDKKWDEILSNEYKVDLENIRPKQDNKYQKLDIEYSGLNVYDSLINAYNSGSDLSDNLTQLEILRDSAVRHSAVSRLNIANEIISKTNNTIVKTKETIDELQKRLKLLRAKLSSQKKEIGKIPTKQSAAKILKTESQIEATNEKLKRAKKRLDSAQRRLDVAMNDAELASDLLNQPESKYTTSVSKPVVVAPKYEVQTIEPEDSELEEENSDDEEIEEISEDENAVKPLFDTDPNILNEDIAFKPIDFDLSESGAQQSTTPVIDFEENNDKEEPEEQIVQEPEDFIAPVPYETEPIVETRSNDMPPIINTQALFDLDNKTENDSYNDNSNEISTEADARSVLESMTPVYDFEETPVVSEQKPIDIRPVDEFVKEPEQIIKESENTYVQPIEKPDNMSVTGSEEQRSKPTFAYYFLLIVLILLSVFTLWLYQKSMDNNTPVLTKKTVETVVKEEKVQSQPFVDEQESALPDIVEETVFLDEPESESYVEQETKSGEEEQLEEPVAELEPEIVTEEPVQESEPEIQEQTEEEILTEEESQEVLEEQPEIVPEEPVQDLVEDNVDIDVQETEEEIIVDKPEYDAGSKHEEMFIIEGENVEDDSYIEADNVPEEDLFYDEEEAEYQAEQEEGFVE